MVSFKRDPETDIEHALLVHGLFENRLCQLWSFLKETLPTMVSFKRDPETDIEKRSTCAWSL